ncbi:MAG TPA: glucose-6-phosphate dehydrogenase, partial [Nocardiopsis listeri]|nr:glucose-6-phosphate dehydrogenase [Nocardiopsis listeri]
MNDSVDESIQTLIILGAQGDLTERLLLPGLGTLVAADSLGDLLLIGSGQGEGTDRRWQEKVA